MKSRRRAYRRVKADYGTFRDDLDGEDASVGVDREKLTPALRAYFALHEMNADWDVIDRTPDAALVSSLAMICPFNPPEKQALLECADTAARCEMMIALMEMALRADAESSERPPH